MKLFFAPTVVVFFTAMATNLERIVSTNYYVEKKKKKNVRILEEHLLNEFFPLRIRLKGVFLRARPESIFNKWLLERLRNFYCDIFRSIFHVVLEVFFWGIVLFSPLLLPISVAPMLVRIIFECIGWEKSQMNSNFRTSRRWKNLFDEVSSCRISGTRIKIWILRAYST